jgi:hypothetical protein
MGGFSRNVRYEKFPVSVYQKNYTDIIGFPLIIIKENSLMVILSNSKRENDNFEAVSNMFRMVYGFAI